MASDTLPSPRMGGPHFREGDQGPRVTMGPRGGTHAKLGGAAVLPSEPGPQAVVALGATVDGTLGSSQPAPQGLVQGSKALGSGHNEGWGWRGQGHI